MGSDLVLLGAEDGIRTRDPHLGKAVEPFRPVGLTPLSSIFSSGFSAEPAESAQFRCAWFNALNRYRTAASPYSIAAMGWGSVELELEVTTWLDTLTDNEFGQVERYIDLLADQGVHLSEPFTRQLDGKLRELRFHLGRQQTRISYYIASGRVIVLLTVFAKTRPRERHEIDRARRAMQRCIDEGHLTQEDQT